MRYAIYTWANFNTQVHHEIKLDATSIVNHPIVVGVPVGTVRVRVLVRDRVGID